MSQLLLVNPRTPRKAKTKAAPRRRRKSVAKSVSNAVTTVRRSASRAGRAVVRRARSRSTRNAAAGIGQTIKHGLIGGVGAVAVDVVAAKLPLPAALTSTPVGRAATRAALGIGLGMLAGKAVGKQNGALIAAGAVNVAAYDLVKSLVGGSLGLNGVTDINGVGFYNPAVAPLAYASDNISGADSMGQYLSGVDASGFDYDTSMSPSDNMFAY